MGSKRLRYAATSWTYQHIRWNPAVELSHTRIRRRGNANFDELDLFVPATKGDIIIDGGANVEGITSKCARTGGTVHAFETNAVGYDILCRRFSLLPNVRIHKLGLMDTGAIERVKMAVVETHERFAPELARQTDELRERLKTKALADRFRLDWD